MSNRTFSRALVRSVRSIAWELRSAWATGHRVSLTIAGDVHRVEGHVCAVSATDAYAVVNGLHVPLESVLAVHRPSRLGDSTYREGSISPWTGAVPAGARRDPRQLSFEASA